MSKIHHHNYDSLIELKRNKKYDLIDQWFLEANFHKNKKQDKELATYILNSNYFFTDFSFNQYCDDVSKNAQFYLDKQNLELCFLKNLTVESGILLLSPSCIANINLNHVQAITKNEEPNFSELINSYHFFAEITKLFHNENFSELTKISTFLKTEMLTIESSVTPVCYTDKNSHGATYIRSDLTKFQPKYDIVYNYSQTKLANLIENNIPLPTATEAERVVEIVTTTFNNTQYGRPQTEKIERLNLSYEKYKSALELTRLEQRYTQIPLTTTRKNKL